MSLGIVADVIGNSLSRGQAVAIGNKSLHSIIGGNFGDMALKRSFKVKPMSSMTVTLKMRDDIVEVNSIQLFMRIVCVMKSENDLMTYLKYKLAPKPPSIFDEVSLRKTQKSALLTLFPSSGDKSEIFKAPTKVIIDGGYLLHALK